MLHCSLLNDRPPWSFNGASLDLDFANGRGWVAPGRNALRDLLTVTRASVGYAEYESGVWLPSASGVARISDKGLLVEEARTNGIRNNSMQGAVAGTPGTLPTNWAISFGANSGDLAATVVGTGTYLGVDYIDIRINGTAAGTGTDTIAFDSTTAIAGTVGQVFVASAFVQIVDGDLTNYDINWGLREYSSAPAFLASQASNISPVIGSTWERKSQQFTVSNASAATVRPELSMAHTVGAIDFTLRIGWPQLELGSFVTSPIRTTTAAATRAQDVVTRAGTFGSSGTIYAEGSSTAAGQINVLLALNDGTSTNRIQLRRSVDGADARFQSFATTAQATLIDSSGWASGETHKMAGAFATDDFDFAFDGVLATPVTSGNVPTVTEIRFGSPLGNSTLNGYLRRAAYFPSRLTDVQLQSLTT